MQGGNPWYGSNFWSSNGQLINLPQQWCWSQICIFLFPHWFVAFPATVLPIVFPSIVWEDGIPSLSEERFWETWRVYEVIYARYLGNCIKSRVRFLKVILVLDCPRFLCRQGSQTSVKIDAQCLSTSPFEYHLKTIFLCSHTAKETDLPL